MGHTLYLTVTLYRFTMLKYPLYFWAFPAVSSYLCILWTCFMQIKCGFYSLFIDIILKKNLSIWQNCNRFFGKLGLIYVHLHIKTLHLQQKSIKNCCICNKSHYIFNKIVTCIYIHNIRINIHFCLHIPAQSITNILHIIAISYHSTSRAWFILAYTLKSFYLACIAFYG